MSLSFFSVVLFASILFDSLYCFCLAIGKYFFSPFFFSWESFSLKVVVECIYILYIQIYSTKRFLRDAMEGNKKTASSSSLTFELFRSKESSSSSGIFGSIFVPSTKLLGLFSIQLCSFKLMFRIYKYVMYFLLLFRFDFHCLYCVMFICFLHFIVLVPILFLQREPSTVCLSLSLSLKLSLSISIELIHTPLSFFFIYVHVSFR